ncbi:Phosphotransferase enzyme family protein [Sphingomonas rubra]|uniref:Aminoglycoside 3'-phosphotransferase n=1 Tax=Sphingomonas rubra TaxID=634430 RepID=A0A1I5S7I3_9SPHN|nr:Phosphotransferase enzyme family protein [Sphingomonas rubra]
MIDADGAWLLMSALAGQTAYQCLADATSAVARGEVVDALARDLSALHALPAAECPLDSGAAVRLVQARARIDAGLVDEDDFGEARAGWDAEQVWDELTRLRPRDDDRVVTHGDYSLDNILMANGRVVGLIDLGRVGMADRYQDLAILADCLDEFDDDLRDRLFATYGIAEPDTDRLDFHLCLDEMF